MAEKTEPPDSVKNIKKKSFGPVSDLEELVLKLIFLLNR